MPAVFRSPLCRYTFALQDCEVVKKSTSKGGQEVHGQLHHIMPCHANIRALAAQSDATWCTDR